MSIENPNQGVSKEAEVDSKPQAKLSVEELQTQMAQLQEQIKAAKEQQGLEQQKSVSEKKQELEKNWTGGSGIEAEKEKLTANIEKVGRELQQFEQVMQQAKELGIPVEQDEGFMASFQAEKNKLAGLEQRQTDLMDKARELASDPEVMGKIQEEALAEDEQIHQEKIRELQAATELAYISVSEKLGSISDELLNDAEMVKAFGLERHSRDSLLKLMDTMPLSDLSKDKLRKTVQDMVADKFKLKQGSLQPIYKFQDRIVAVLENDEKVNKYLELRAKL